MEKDGEKIKEDNSIYEFSKILKKKRIKGKTYYKVEWKDGSIPTLEPKENFINCDYLINKFEEEERKKKLVPKKKKKKMKSLGNKNLNNTKKIIGRLDEDYPLKVINVKFDENIENTKFEIEWHRRENGIKPLNSIINLYTLFEYSKNTRVFISKYLINYIFNN